MSVDPQNVQTLNGKIAQIARMANGQTWMGPGCMIDDGNGPHSPANFCEAVAETFAAMATGIRIRFPSAENHYQNLLAQGLINTTDMPPEGTFVFYHWNGDLYGHIVVSTGNWNGCGTCINPNAILELPLNHYTGYAGWATSEVVIRAAKDMPPADPTGGGLGRRNGNYRAFSWLKDANGQEIIVGNAFLEQYDAMGGAAGMYGLPTNNEHDEEGQVVQNFERARFIYHPDTNSVEVQ